MKILTYSIEIDKPRASVFDKIMDKTIYADWAKAWGEEMTYEGNWVSGEHISFFDTSGNGTKVLVEEVVAPKHIKVTHVAMVEAGNKEVVELDDIMKKWIGSKEEYYFTDSGEGKTMFEVRIVTDEAFEEMMNAWPTAVQFFKELCEAK